MAFSYDLNLNTKLILHYLSEPVLNMKNLFSGKPSGHDKEFRKYTIGFSSCFGGEGVNHFQSRFLRHTLVT